jgi:hypothetical protein
MLLDMLPGLVIDDAGNTRMLNGKHAYKFSLAMPKRVEFPDGSNIIFGKYMMRISFAKRRAPLRSHIMQIICIGAKKKMRWVYAVWGIAFMKNAQIVSDFSVGKSPRCSMSFETTFSSPYTKLTVSTTPTTSFPWPTGIGAARLINLIPEAFNIFRGIIEVKHQNLHSGGPVGIAVPRPAFSMGLSIPQLLCFSNGGKP